MRHTPVEVSLVSLSSSTTPPRKLVPSTPSSSSVHSFGTASHSSGKEGKESRSSSSTPPRKLVSSTPSSCSVHSFGCASDSSANDGKEEAQLELSSHSSFDDLLCETVTTTRVSPLHRSSFVSRVWYCALALSALLDFASSWTHQIEVERWGEFWAVSHSKRHPNYKRDMTFIPLPTFWATLAANSALFS